MNLRDKVIYAGKEYEIAGLSNMVYDQDCEGEAEWKHTKELQEIALVEPFESARVFVKPFWVKANDPLLSTPQAEEEKK